MNRKNRHRFFNGAIALSAIAGGLVLTHHFSESGSGGSFATTPSSTTSAAPTTSSTPSAKADMTVTGAPINYFYGTIQVSVTRKAGKLTAVGLIQAQATNGRESAFPYLQQYAIASQGTNFANLSGATYTTDAFKQALNSAISKLS